MTKAVLKIILEIAFIFIGASIAFSYSVPVGNLFIIAYFAAKLYVKRYVLYSSTANRYYRANQIEKAITYFQKAIKVASCRPRVIVSYAYLLLRQGELEECEKVINLIEERRLKLEVRDEMNFNLVLSLLSWKKGDLDKAIEILEKVYKNYKNSTLYESLGYLLVLKGDYDKALAFNLEALEYNNSSEIILDNLGECYYYLGQFDKSYDIYEKLLSKPISFPEPYYFLGMLLKHKGKLQEAVESLEKAKSCKESFLSDLKMETIEKELELVKAELPKEDLE